MIHYRADLPIGAPQVERFEHGGAALVDESVGRSADRHIVFLHGWGGSRESLRGIGVLFQHARRVHLIDLPGFGDAPLPPSDWGTSHYADLIQHYLIERVEGRVVLVGHSFGARIALRLAARTAHPLGDLAEAAKGTTIESLVLMGVPGLPPQGLSRARVRRGSIGLLRKLLRALQPVVGEAPLAWQTRRFGSKDYLAAGALRPILVRTVNEDLTACARSVSCPVLLLWGSDDTEAPPSLGHRYRDLMNGRATLEVLSHKDHYLFAGTGAHLCAFKIRNWLESHGR